MQKQLNHNAATYGPMQQKNFTGALGAFFAQECPQLGGKRTRQVLVQSIVEIVHQFFPETSHLRPGQIQWTTVDRAEKASYGKRASECRLTSVVLDLVRTEDIAQRAAGKKLRQIKKEATARLFEQAYEQGGCMTNAELAILLKISAPTVSKYAREWEADHQQLLPRRGTIHDLGPTLTHKKQIIEKLFLEGKSVEQVQRETYHSPEAIHRYITAFKQVLLCRRKGLSCPEVAYAVKKSIRLVEEYFRLIDEMAERNYNLEKLLQSESFPGKY
jgi:predicted transcriptional regulator